ncbi:Germin-like protein 8-14 [Senna tora]|uniref:Germin-like protein 8-14 n=1 Tax=Senna tora TaxID=362788 RepID=A0A834T3N2_9FABA|nr:Germin-like protein 8-14 [Senna tora]
MKRSKYTQGEKNGMKRKVTFSNKGEGKLLPNKAKSRICKPGSGSLKKTKPVALLPVGFTWKCNNPFGNTIRSSLAAESPSPLTPGYWPTKAGLTAALMMFVVFPDATKPENTKSFTVTLTAGMHG